MSTTTAEPSRYVYTDRDGTRHQDPAIRAYGSRFVGQTCERAGAWWRGKALVRFTDGTVVVVRARLLRKTTSNEPFSENGEINSVTNHAFERGL